MVPAEATSVVGIARPAVRARSNIHGGTRLGCTGPSVAQLPVRILPGAVGFGAVLPGVVYDAAIRPGVVHVAPTAPGVLNVAPGRPGVAHFPATRPGVLDIVTTMPGIHSVAALFPGVVHHAGVLPGAVRTDVGIKLVCLTGTAGNVAPQGLGFLAALFSFFCQPCRINFRLLGIRTGPDGLRFPLAGIDFHVLGFAPDLGGLLPVLLVPFFLHCLPAPASGQEQQHDQRHHNNGNYNPYPWSCVHVSHHFPLRCDRAGPRLPADIFGTVITRLARVLTIH